MLDTVGNNKMTYLNDQDRRVSNFYHEMRLGDLGETERKRALADVYNQDPTLSIKELNYRPDKSNRLIGRTLNFEGEVYCVYLDKWETRGYDRKSLLKCCQYILRGFTHDYVYTLYGDRDEAIYIGKTGDLDARMSQHYTTKAWWHEVKRISFEALSFKDASIVEKEFIHLYKPKYNLTHNKTIKKARPRMPPVNQTTKYIHLNEKKMA